MLQLIVDKEQSLKEFTENNYAQGSFFWNYLLKNKDVRINGVRMAKDARVYPGDVVCYYLMKKQEEKPAFFDVYTDENILVIDKESGVNAEAVFAALSRRFAGAGKECYFIHRLDRNTKGLMVFALNRQTETELLQAFKERRVEKIYHALCVGEIVKKRDVLTAYLKKDATNALVRVYDAPTADAEKIITEYAVLQKISEQLTLIEVTLHTGKTHQIRAHLAHAGHPVLGDMKYGQTMANKAWNAARQCLVAKQLSFQMQGSLAYLNDKKFISRFDAESAVMQRGNTEKE